MCSIAPVYDDIDTPKKLRHNQYNLGTPKMVSDVTRRPDIDKYPSAETGSNSSIGTSQTNSISVVPLVIVRYLVPTEK